MSPRRCWGGRWAQEKPKPKAAEYRQRRTDWRHSRLADHALSCFRQKLETLSIDSCRLGEARSWPKTMPAALRQSNQRAEQDYSIINVSRIRYHIVFWQGTQKGYKGSGLCLRCRARHREKAARKRCGYCW
eukprot:6025842-Pyramimonas_sp.AAC.1